MSNNIIGTVNNAAGGNSAGGGGNHDFPAALPYAHWRALGKDDDSPSTWFSSNNSSQLAHSA